MCKSLICVPFEICHLSSQARLHLLLLHHFKLWKKNAAEQHQQIADAVEAVETRRVNNLLTYAFYRWKRQFYVENLAR